MDRGQLLITNSFSWYSRTHTFAPFSSMMKCQEFQLCANLLQVTIATATMSSGVQQPCPVQLRASCSYSLSVPSYLTWCSLGLGWDDVDIPYGTEISEVYLFSTHWPVSSFSSNHHLLQKGASLTKVKRIISP